MYQLNLFVEKSYGFVEFEVYKLFIIIANGLK